MNRLNIIILFSFILFILGCSDKKNKSTATHHLKKDTVSKKIESQKMKQSIGKCHIGKLAVKKKNPSNIIIKAIKNRDVSLLLKNVDLNFYTSYEDYQTNNELFNNYWKINKGAKSSFWTLLDNLIKQGGFYKNDSTYVMPIYASMIKDFTYDCDNKLIVVTKGYIYEKPSFLSKIVTEIHDYKVLTYNPKKTNYKIFNKKYQKLGYPAVTEFDKDLWYFIPKHKGYINGSEVWLFGNTNIYISKTNDKWVLSHLIVND